MKPVEDSDSSAEEAPRDPNFDILFYMTNLPKMKRNPNLSLEFDK